MSVQDRNVRRRDIATRIARRCGCNRDQAALITWSLLDQISTSLGRSDRVLLRGFGKFERCPRRPMHFVPGKTMREAVA